MTTLIKGRKVVFKNKPTATGFETYSINDCLIATRGTSEASRPQITIHLPKKDPRDVVNSWVEHDGFDWHVTAVTAVQMNENTPTRWDRYAIAERIKAL